jgi:hypothetical protein
MRHAGPARRALGVRTAFNLLGPLTNPAGATRQLVGVPRPEFTELLARSLAWLGSERAWVVHGSDGIDEISTTGYTKVSECRNGSVNTFYVQDSVCEPMVADRIVHAPRDHVRRARPQRPHERPVNAAPLVHVNQSCAARGPHHGKGVAGDLPNVDAEIRYTLDERRAAARDKCLANVAGREPPDQQLRLALTAAIALGRVDVNDLR